MAKLADAQDLGSCIARCAGSSPVARTNKRGWQSPASLIGTGNRSQPTPPFAVLRKTAKCRRSRQANGITAKTEPGLQRDKGRRLCRVQVLLSVPNKHRNYDTKAYRKSGAYFLSGSLDFQGFSCF